MSEGTVHLHSRDIEPEWQTEPTTLGHQAASFWLNVLFWLTWKMPWLSRILPGVGVWAAWTFSPALRRRTLANARRLLGATATPAEQRRLARAVIRSFYLFVDDVGRHARMTREEIAARTRHVHGMEHYDAARAAGKGVIIATAHMGSFEVGIAALRRHEPVIHVVFQRDRLGLFERLRTQLRQTLDVHEAPVDEGIAGWAKLRAALGRNEAVLMQADRVMPGQKGLAVPFLGGEMELPLGVVKLAALAGSPILPVFTRRNADGTVDVAIEPVIDPDDVSAFIRATAPPPSLWRLASVIEKHVAAHPDQWMMIRPAWRESGRAS